MKKINCPFLNISKTEEHPTQKVGLTIHRSPFMGDYFMSDLAQMELDDYSSRIKIKDLNSTQALINCAHKILSANQLNTTPYLITNDQFPDFKKNINQLQKLVNKEVILINLEETMKETVDHTLKATTLLLELSKQTIDQQAFAVITPRVQDMILSKISGKNELAAILKYLIEEKLIDGKLLNGAFLGYEPETDSPFNDEYSFTMKGWERIRIEKEKTNTNKVFIATSFHWEKDNEIRIEIIEAIKSACLRLGWIADVVSQSHTEYITDKILSEIKSCKFVVAELTYHNRGVYFESGFARGLGKNVFHIVNKDFTKTDREADADSQRMHFDIQQVQYRSWSTPTEAEEQLYDWINSTVGPYKNN